MTDKELCRISFGAMPMPSGLSLSEQEAFQGLRYLYQRHANGMVSKDQASAEKQLILKVLRNEKEQATVYAKLMDRCIKLERDIQHAASAYNRERTLEHADALIAAVYGSWAVGGDNHASD